MQVYGQMSRWHIAIAKGQPLAMLDIDRVNELRTTWPKNWPAD